MTGWSDAAAAYLVDHAIDPEVAADCGTEGSGTTIRYAYRRPDGRTFQRTRHLAGEYAGRTIQPRGEPLCLWWPIKESGGRVLVAEGEPDALAVISVLRRSAKGDGAAAYLRAALAGLCAVPGTGYPAAKLADDLRAAGAREVVLALDGDEPGRGYAEKAAEALTAAGIACASLPLPEGEDVASLLAASDDRVGLLADLLTEAEAQLAEPNDDEAEIADLLDLAGGTLDRYLVLPGPAERTALQLFAAHTWATEGAHATPYLLVVSPEKRSGKSRLLEVLELLVARPWRVTGASEAALFRKIAQSHPTLLLDEIDAIFGSHSERTEPLRAIINAGNRPGATVARCVNHGAEVEDYEVFGAKVLAGIDSGHRIPDTIRDRSVTIHMQRKTGAEPVERFRHRDADAEAEPIREGFERWAEGAVDRLLTADPHLPPELDDRAAEGWEPLLAIADQAGGDWPRRAREAAVALSGEEDRDETTIGTLLLGAIRDAFGDADRMRSTDLLDAINAEEELPFGGWREGKGLDGRDLARKLKPYHIKSKPINLGGDARAKGYLRDQFEEAWERWLPAPDEAVTSVTGVTDADAVTENSALESQSNRVTDVTAKSGGTGAGEAEDRSAALAVGDAPADRPPPHRADEWDFEGPGW